MQTTLTTNSNLIQNPNFEVDYSYWAEYHNPGSIATLLSIDTTVFYQGKQSLKLVTGASGNSYAGTSYNAAGLIIGATYTLSVYAQGSAGGENLNLYIADATNDQTTFSLTTTWQRFTQTFVASATSTIIYVRSGTAAATFWIDAAQLENRSSASAYFDGNSGLGYYWTGTANLSSSFYRAFEVESNSSAQQTIFGIQISWLKTLNPIYVPFTIGSSIIGGADFILSSNNAIGLFGEYQYGNYSDYGLSWSVQKSLGQYPYGVMIAQASVELDNDQNTFSPGFDPQIGNYITPQRPLILSTGYRDINETINVFEGITTAPENDIADRRTTLNAYDYVNYLGSFKSTTTPDQINVSPEKIIAALLLEAGFTPQQFILEPSLQSPLGYFSCFGQLALDLILQLCEAEQGIFFADENGYMRFWNRQHVLTNNTLRWSFSFNSLVNAKIENTPIINDVTVAANPRSLQARSQLYALTTPFQIPPAQQTQSAVGQVRNIIKNPSFERDINYWSTPAAGGGYTPPNISQTTTSYTSGLTHSAYALKSQGVLQAGSTTSYSSPAATLVASGGGFNNPDFTGNANNAPFVPGKTYTVQMQVNAAAGLVATLGWGWRSNYNLQTTQSGTTAVTLAATGWNLVTYTWTAPDANANDTFGYGGQYYITISTNDTTANNSMLIDQVCLTQTSSASTYFDGSTPYTSAALYQWESTVSESSSLMIPITTIAGTYNFTATFNDPAANIDTPVYAAPLLTTASSYNTNIAANGTGASYSSYISVINAQNIGGSFSATFQNAYQQPIYVTALQLFGQSAKIKNNISIEYTDQASVTKYGINPANNYAALAFSNDAIQDIGTANALAYSVVLDYAKPYARVTADVIATPHLQFGDWVTLTFDDTTQSGSYVIVGSTISETVDEGLTQQLQLEVKNQVRYFTIATSSIGGADPISP